MKFLTKLVAASLAIGLTGCGSSHSDMRGVQVRTAETVREDRERQAILGLARHAFGEEIEEDPRSYSFADLYARLNAWIHQQNENLTKPGMGKAEFHEVRWGYDILCKFTDMSVFAHSPDPDALKKVACDVHDLYRADQSVFFDDPEADKELYYYTFMAARNSNESIADSFAAANQARENGRSPEKYAAVVDAQIRRRVARYAMNKAVCFEMGEESDPAYEGWFNENVKDWMPEDVEQLREIRNKSRQEMERYRSEANALRDSGEDYSRELQYMGLVKDDFYEKCDGFINSRISTYRY